METITLELTKVEARVLLELIKQFHWAGQNLENTETNVAVGTSVREKLKKALEAKIS